MRRLFLALAIASLLMLPSLTPAQKYADDESLILYLPFNEGEGETAFDRSRLGNHGKLEGPQWVFGKFGKALEFDGEDDVVIIETKDSKELQMEGSDGTLECWFMMKGEGNANLPRLIAKESVTNDWVVAPLRGGYTLRFQKHAKFNLQLSVEEGSREINKEKKEAGVDFNVWYHGAGTWKKGEHRVYLNGKLVNEDKAADLTFPVEDKENDLRIGGTFAGFRNFQGTIDEVRIWNRALSVNEISDNMKLGFGQILSVSPAGQLTTTWGQIKAWRK